MTWSLIAQSLKVWSNSQGPYAVFTVEVHFTKMHSFETHCDADTCIQNLSQAYWSYGVMYDIFVDAYVMLLFVFI